MSPRWTKEWRREPIDATCSNSSRTTRSTAATDGACSGNPGPGGWGYVLVDANGNDVRVDSGDEPHTTNQRMELQAAIAALEGAPPGCTAGHPQRLPLRRTRRNSLDPQLAPAGVAYRRRQGGRKPLTLGRARRGTGHTHGPHELRMGQRPRRTPAERTSRRRRARRPATLGGRPARTRGAAPQLGPQAQRHPTPRLHQQHELRRAPVGKHVPGA